MDFKLTEIISIVFSSVALFFTFRKDAHRISLEVTPDFKSWIDVLGIGNDSSFSVGVLSVGYLNALGNVVWQNSVGDHKTNQFVVYPIRVESRSLFMMQILLPRQNIDLDAPHGYCVQLECGRVYVIQHTAPFIPCFKFHIASFLSRLSAGRYAPWLERSRLTKRS